MTRWDEIKRAVGKNLVLKFLALILALALWFHISRKGQEYFSLTLPVTVAHLPSHLELKSSTPDQVTLTLEGPPGLGSRIRTDNLSILLDGQSFKPGRQSIHLKRSMITLPTAVSIVRFTPRTVSLVLMPLFRKTVPILPQFIGQEHGRITPLKVRITPNQATIEGDTTSLAGIRFLKTRPIELSQLTGNTQQTFNIPLMPPNFSHVRLLSPLSVVVTVDPVKKTR
jgi:YbbR domain-containing protein